MRALATSLLLATSTVVAFGQSVDLSKYTIVDLSHAYGPSTVFWPTSPTTFALDRRPSRSRWSG